MQKSPASYKSAKYNFASSSAFLGKEQLFYKTVMVWEINHSHQETTVQDNIYKTIVVVRKCTNN